MAENRNESPLPEFDPIQGLVDFFDTQDMGAYMAQMPEAQFEVDIKTRRYLVAIDGALMKRLSEIARSQHVSTESLIASWLEEKAAVQSA